MALTAHPIASLPAPRRPSGTTTEPWRDAIIDYRPPAGPDGCWASDPLRTPAEYEDAGPGRS